MAVFTPVNEAEFIDWAKSNYGFATVSALTPIAEGIENSNYWFIADARKYVFTIFELWDEQAVDYYSALIRYLEKQKLPVCAPITPTNANNSFGGNKPMVIVPYVEGVAHLKPSEKNCQQMGSLVAQLHCAVTGFEGTFDNPRGASWRQMAAAKVLPHLSPAQKSLVTETMQMDAHFQTLNLPSAACHCDLFRNNILWLDDEVNAVIDFYFGGHDIFIFDLAVCVCDWCFVKDENKTLHFSEQRFQALLKGYRMRRSLSPLECRYFAQALAVAALRFWLSRLADVFYPREASHLTPHDPAYFEIILQIVRELEPQISKIVHTENAYDHQVG